MCTCKTRRKVLKVVKRRASYSPRDEMNDEFIDDHSFEITLLGSRAIFCTKNEKSGWTCFNLYLVWLKAIFVYRYIE